MGALLIFWVLLSATAGSLDISELPWDFSRHSCVWKDPVLILGASVSAPGAQSMRNPVQILRRNSTVVGEVSNWAYPGSRSTRQIDRLLSGAVPNVKTVFALDLFFWDSVFAPCARGLENLERLLQWVGTTGTHLVVGNIPVAVNADPPVTCGQKINARLEQCKNIKNCYLIDVNDFYQKIVTSGSYSIGTKSYTLEDLRPDGIHPSEIGAAIFAEYILRSFDTQPPCVD